MMRSDFYLFDLISERRYADALKEIDSYLLSLDAPIYDSEEYAFLKQAKREQALELRRKIINRLQSGG